MRSLPSDLASTVDLEPNVTPRQLVAETKAQFTDSTPTTHLSLTQEAKRTTLTAGGDLDEYIAKHRTIRTKIRLGQYPSIR